MRRATFQIRDRARHNAVQLLRRQCRTGALRGTFRGSHRSNAWGWLAGLLAALALWDSSAVLGQPSSGRPIGDLRPLLKQLERGSPAERDAAEKALIAKGPALLNRLPSPNEVASAELKVRLERIIRQLKQQRIEQVVDATRLTLNGSHSLIDLFQEVERQTGNRLQLTEKIDGDRKVDVDWRESPFWSSIDQVLDEADLTIDSLATESGVLIVVDRTAGTVGRFGLADYQGAFRFEATQVTAARNLRVPDDSSLRIRVETMWEPRVAPIALSFPFAQFNIEFEESTPVPPVNVGAEPSFPIRPDMASVDLLIEFPLPPRGVEELKVLRGRCDVLLPAQIGEFVFENLEKDRKKKVQQGQVTVTLLDVRKNEELYEVFLEVEFERAESAFQSHFAWILDNPTYIADDQGKKHEPLGMHTVQRTMRSIRLAYLFDLKTPLTQYRLIYASPVGIVRKTIEFELHDVELP